VTESSPELRTALAALHPSLDRLGELAEELEVAVGDVRADVTELDEVTR
jgi:hypothetical protein